MYMILTLAPYILLTDLMDALRRAYTPAPHVELMEVMFHIRSWIKPVAISLHNITNPHCFVIQKAASGDVVLRYKNWSRDKEWLPSQDPMECIQILKVTANLVVRHSQHFT